MSEVDPEELDTGLIICAVYEGFWQLVDPDYMPGSKMITCSCGHPGLISPSGQAFMERKSGMYTICFTCFKAEGKQLKNRQAALVPGSEEEFKQWVNKGQTSQEAINRLKKRFGLT